MSGQKVTKYLIITFCWLAVLYPLWVRLETLHWTSTSSILPNLFPLFGLAAASLLWLHSMSGVFEPWLRANFDFDRFVNVTANMILVCIIAHPLLLLAMLGFNFTNIFLFYGTTYIWIGILGWLLLMTYDITKPLKKYDFFAKHWNVILVISNIGFLLTFIHSLALGSDLQSGPLRVVWIFYGITATLAIVYTYGIKKLLK